MRGGAHHGRRPFPTLHGRRERDMTERLFDLPEEIEEFRKLVRKIAEERIAPRAAEVDETDEWPKDLWEVMVEHGLMGVGYPEEFGGGATPGNVVHAWSRGGRLCGEATRERCRLRRLHS